MTTHAPPHAGAPAPASGGARASRGWWLVALLAVAAAALLVVNGYTRTVRAADVSADRGAGPVLAVPAVAQLAPPPVALVVPSLGLDTRLAGLGVDRDGALQVPEDPSRAGWYADGPAPGDAGPAVLAGHLDGPAGPGVFAGLPRLRPGDAVSVRRADGTVARFAVDEVQTFAKREFPTARVYAADGTPRLRIITCGGDVDPATGRYRSNTVVFATLAAVTGPG